MELKRRSTAYIGPQLRAVPWHRRGQQLLAVRDREYQVVLDPGRLPLASGFSVREVIEGALAQQPECRRWLHRTRPRTDCHWNHRPNCSLGRPKSVVVGATPQGAPVTIAHIGEARFGPSCAAVQRRWMAREKSPSARR